MNHVGMIGRAHGGMLVWAAIVGSSFPVVGMMSEGLPPLTLTAIRFAVAALAVGVLLDRQGLRLPTAGGALLYVLMGLCLAGFFGTMFWAAHRATALSMATLYVSVPLIAYAAGRLVGVEAPGGRLPLILAVGALGALLLAWAGAGGSAAGFGLGPAEAAYFAGCVGSALFPVLSKWGLNRGLLPDRAADRTFWSLLFGSAVVAAAALAMEDTGAIAGLRPADAAILGYLAVFSSGATFWLMQSATGVLTPGAVTGYTYLTPFVSMTVLFAIAPEQIGWRWAPGAALVVLATLLLLRSGAPVPPSAGRAVGDQDARQGRPGRQQVGQRVAVEHAQEPRQRLVEDCR